MPRYDVSCAAEDTHTPRCNLAMNAREAFKTIGTSVLSLAHHALGCKNACLSALRYLLVDKCLQLQFERRNRLLQ